MLIKRTRGATSIRIMLRRMATLRREQASFEPSSQAPASCRSG